MSIHDVPLSYKQQYDHIRELELRVAQLTQENTRLELEKEALECRIGEINEAMESVHSHAVNGLSTPCKNRHLRLIKTFIELAFPNVQKLEQRFDSDLF